jgi:gluconate 2-dehydrogenase gamma chain
MDELSLSRRHFLSAAGSIALWLAASPSDLLAASSDDHSGYRVLTAAQAASFDAFAAQVIPSEPGSPGAREANVTRFADNALASFVKEQRPAFEKALSALDAEAGRVGTNGKSFSALSSSQQIAVMQTMDKSQHDAFETLRIAVLAGMFAAPSYGGNSGKVGWKLIGFEDRFFWQPPFGFYDRDVEVRRRD